MENSQTQIYEDGLHKHWGSYSNDVLGLKNVEKIYVTSDIQKVYETCYSSFATILFQELSRSKETSSLLPVCIFKSGNRSSNEVWISWQCNIYKP